MNNQTNLWIKLRPRLPSGIGRLVLMACLFLALLLGQVTLTPAGMSSALLDEPELLASGNPYDVAVRGGYAFWTDRQVELCVPGSGEGRLIRVNLTTLTATTLRVGSDCDFDPANVAADDDHVYYIDLASETIQRIPVGGGAPITVASGREFKRTLALDSTHIYFSDAEGVRRVLKAGGTPDTLAAGYDITKLALDDDYVYWTEWVGGDAIRRAPKEGGVVDTLLSDSGLDGPWGIAVDDTHVYWTEMGSGQARRMPKTGGTPDDLVSPDSFYWGMDIAVDGTDVYWMDTGGGPNGRLRKAPKGGGAVENLALGLSACTGLNLTATHVYWGDGDGVKRLSIEASEVRVDLTIFDMEITQGIQNLDPATPDVPLVAEKTTFVRAYPFVDTADTPFVTAWLRGFRGGVELPGSPVSPIDPTVYVTSRGVYRPSLSETFNFWVPPSWRSGTVEFQVEINPAGAIPESNTGNNTFSKTVTFHSRPPVCPVMVPVRTHAPRYDIDSPGFWDIIGLMRRLWPVPDVWVYYQSDDDAEVELCWWGIFPYPCSGPYELPDDDWKIIASLVIRDIFSDDPDECDDIDARTHYVGMVHPDTDTGTLLGYATYDWASALFVKMLTDPADSGNVPYFTPRGGAILAHELAHNEDRMHVDCGGAPDIDTGYPYPPCQIDNVGPDRHYGFDSHSMSVIRPDEARDFMSYGGPQWVSDYTWEALFNRLGSSSSREMAAAETLSPEVLTQAPEILVVTGVITETTGAASLEYLYRLPQGEIGEKKLRKLGERQLSLFRSGAAYSLDLQDTSGAVLASHSFNPPDPNEGGIHQQFLLTVPFEPQTARVVLLREGAEKAARDVSPNLPQVHVLTPNGGEVISNELTIKWEAEDEDNDALLYTIQYSPDLGETWRVVATNVPTITLTISDTISLPGSQQALIRVIANDGVNTGSDTSDEPFTVLPHPPIAHIFSPADGATFAPGTQIILTGMGIDAEDGPLGDEALSWLVDGEYQGEGKELALTGLAPGSHVVALKATDSNEMTAGHSISIFVGPTIYLAPSPSTVSVSGTFTMEIRIDDIENLYGAQVELSFDPTIVEVVDAYDFAPGVQIEVGDFPVPDVVLQNAVNNSTGGIAYIISLQGPKPPGVSGSGVLARIVFHGLEEGTSEVEFTRVILADPQSVEIEALSRDGLIVVQQATGTVSGKVILERRASNAGASVAVDGLSATTPEDGSYTVASVPPGEHTVSVSRMSYLRTWREVTVTAGETLNLPDVTLLGGDVNKDDHIDHADGILIGQAWNSTPTSPRWDERADITDDDAVNILDMVAVYFNWDQRAPGPWAATTLAPSPTQAQIPKVPRSQTARATTRVIISPSVAMAPGLGSPIRVDIYVEDVADLYGFRVQLSFDPTIVRVRDADPYSPGVQIIPGDFLDPFNQFVLVNTADNLQGAIDFSVTQTYPAEARDGSGVLGAIIFEGVEEGSSAVHFDEVSLLDDTLPDPLEIPAETQDGMVTIASSQRFIYLPIILKSHS